MSASAHALSAIEFELRRARELTQGGQHADALAVLDALAALDALALAAAEHRDVVFLQAVNLRYLKRIPAALDALQRLEQRHAHFGRLYQERGHCHAACGRWPAAIEAFARAAQVNPALLNSWRMLEQLYRAQGDVANAAVAAEHASQLQRQPAAVMRAGSLFSDGEFAAAEEVLREYLSSDAQHLEAMRLLARVLLARGALLEAERLLQAVLALNPEYVAARADYARALLRAQRFSAAHEQAEALLRREPQHPDYLALCAAACAGLGEHIAAIDLYGRIVAAEPSAPEIHLSRGHSFRAIGRPWEAIESYHAAAATKPSFGDAYWSLANLKVYRFSKDEAARMTEAANAPATSLVDRYHLCFALGREFENRGRYADAWEYYQRGNALKATESPYRAEVVKGEARRQTEVCTAALFAAHAGVGAAATDPIFIVGLPRSGSTLIEQILASHSRVQGTHELAVVPRLVAELRGSESNATSSGDPLRYPEVLAHLPPQQFRALGERYLSEAGVYRREADRPFFIDKMPNNFRHLGLIHLMLPNAKIIDVRREPLACCVSNLKQLYASGQEFSYSAEAIAHYYRNYLKLMRHWDAAMPGRILRVRYEDVVQDLEAGVRRILGYCQLDFEPACLEFHRTRRSVYSASSEQVRRPIFREGLTQWRHFERWLGPLEEALGDARVRYRE